MHLIEKYSKFFLVTLLLLFLFYFYHEVILSPNSYLYGSSGDGIKNYFTFVDQIKEGSYTQSTAMNYPYGEHFLYLDCHPGLTIIIKIVAKVFPFVETYSVAIINLLMIASIGLSAWFLYLIFIRYSIRPFVAVIAAFSIAVLSPQLFRITGHYALGYSFFIPITWYLFLRFRESEKKWKWSILIGLNTLFWFFTHAYLGMIIVTFFLACYMIEGVLSFKEKMLNPKFWAYLFVQLLIPFLFIFLYSKLGDTHTGRTNNPYGFLEVASNFDSVFIPNHRPLAPYFNQFELHQIWEGLAYVGIGTIVGFIILIGYSIFWLIRYRRFPFKELQIPQQLVIAMAAAVIVLFVAFGYPFKWYPELLNYFSVIKNFRGIGRFTWVFYYVSTIFVIVFIYRVFHLKGKTFLATIPAILIAFSFIWEGVPYHRTISQEVSKIPNYFNKNLLTDEWNDALKTVDFSNYQAIIPLPFYHIGSENFGKVGSDGIYITSMVLGYYSNLPLVANHSGRTSIWESKNSMQIISPVFYKKVIEKDIKDERPFLIVYRNEDLLDSERDLLNRSKEIYRNSEFTLYELTKAALFSTDASKWLNDFDAKKDQLTTKGDFLLDTPDSSAYIFFDNYEDKPNKISFKGQGALQIPKRGYTLLKKFEVGELEEGKEYIASFWLYNNGKNYGQDIPNGLFIHQVEYENPEWVHFDNISASLTINGDWSLVEMKFTGFNNYESILILKGDDISRIIWNIDDLMIRPANTTVYRIDKGELMMNNHRIKRRA